MKKHGLWTAGILVALAVVVPLGWYLLSPLFINKTVDEALPAVTNGQVVEAAPAQEKATVTPVAEAEVQATPTPAPQAAPEQKMDEPMPAKEPEMAVLAAGSFYNVVHDGSGQATRYRLADGSRVLRLEDFKVLNGPDLHVYLTSADPVPSSIGGELPDYLDLGKLKGNIGNQNYALPAGIDLTKYRSVVIWCQPFHVPFIAAPLNAPLK